MKAIDTNILVRLLVRDNLAQTVTARDVVREGAFVPITVLLELGWVLKSNYGFSRQKIAIGLTELLDNPSTFFEDQPALRAAVDLYANGADFADAIHLVASRGAEAFVTFDRKVPSSDEIGVPVEILS